MRFLQFLTEAGLSGKSRSGGISNWDYYIVKNFNLENKYDIDKSTDLIDLNKNVIKNLNKGDKVTILSKELVTIGRSKFAEVKSGNDIGYISISSIRKPTASSSDNIIPGGKNSKEFTPDKLGMIGINFNSLDHLMNTAIKSIGNYYTGQEYKSIRNYLRECIALSTKTSYVSEDKYTKTYNLKNNHNIAKQDISILSKNFGEILAALYTFANNKKCSSIIFPEDISQGLYDYIMIDKNGINHYISVKSKGGSSTSMENLNFVIRNFSKGNRLFNIYKEEISVIMSLMNNKVAGKTTIKNIENFFNDTLYIKKNAIIKELNTISKIKITDISQDSLTKWFSDVVENSTEEKFILTMNKIYSNILGDLGKPPKTDERVLKEMFKRGNGKSFDNGYLYYPMGSYIVKYLNDYGDYKKVLNILLNYGTFIQQIEVNLENTTASFTITKFKESQFAFSYNGMSKAPGNRPIGFKQK